MSNTAPITVDKCPDANGHLTLRFADGTANGNTEAQPIATVYEQADADFIAQAWNAHDELLRACQRVLRAIEWAYPRDQLSPQQQADELRYAIAKATQ